MSAPPGHRQLHDRLLAAYGPQHWWPADGPFEVMVGAVLTQNTNWGNVERAIQRLKVAEALDPMVLLAGAPEQVAEWIRPAGTFRVKAARLRNLCRWLADGGGYQALTACHTAALRAGLLAINGVGPETADSILLYAFQRPVFVIDAYTRRILARLGYIAGGEGYEALRAQVEEAMPADPAMLGEYHALLVRHAKEACRVRPRCDACCLREACPRCGL